MYVCMSRDTTHTHWSGSHVNPIAHFNIPQVKVTLIIPRSKTHPVEYKETCQSPPLEHAADLDASICEQFTMMKVLGVLNYFVPNADIQESKLV